MSTLQFHLDAVMAENMDIKDKLLNIGSFASHVKLGSAGNSSSVQMSNGSSDLKKGYNKSPGDTCKALCVCCNVTRSKC